VAKQDVDDRWLIANVGNFNTKKGLFGYTFSFEYTEYIGNVGPPGECYLFADFEQAELFQLNSTSLVPDLQGWFYCTACI